MQKVVAHANTVKQRLQKPLVLAVYVHRVKASAQRLQAKSSCSLAE